MPIRVYVPVVSHDQTLESKLKFMTKGKEKWRTGKSLQEVQLPGVFVSIKNQKTQDIFLNLRFLKSFSIDWHHMERKVSRRQEDEDKIVNFIDRPFGNCGLHCLGHCGKIKTKCINL